MTAISAQDPAVLLESLIALGPSHDGAVERDLRNALTRLSRGLANLHAILDDQPHLNSALSVVEIKTILENKGDLMPSEAVVWFREARGTLGHGDTAR